MTWTFTCWHKQNTSFKATELLEIDQSVALRQNRQIWLRGIPSTSCHFNSFNMCSPLFKTTSNWTEMKTKPWFYYAHGHALMEDWWNHVKQANIEHEGNWWGEASWAWVITVWTRSAVWSQYRQYSLLNLKQLAEHVACSANWFSTKQKTHSFAFRKDQWAASKRKW